MLGPPTILDGQEWPPYSVYPMQGLEQVVPNSHQSYMQMVTFWSSNSFVLHDIQGYTESCIPSFSSSKKDPRTKAPSSTSKADNCYWVPTINNDLFILPFVRVTCNSNCAFISHHPCFIYIAYSTGSFSFFWSFHMLSMLLCQWSCCSIVICYHLVVIFCDVTAQPPLFSVGNFFAWIK